MAAGLGFKDFVTGEVLTAADVDGYLMQGVWVFASAAARDAAVTSPQEGNFAYLKDTNATTYYTGSAWASVGGSSGALAFIKKVDFTTASSIDFSDSFSATYVNYLLIGNYTGTADNDLLYRYRVGGADNSTSNYNMQVFDVDGTNVTGGRIATGTNGRIGPTLASGTRISNTCYFIAPFLTQTKGSRSENVRGTSTAITLSQIGTGFNAATSFTGLTIYPGSGTVTGTFAIFGYTNA